MKRSLPVICAGLLASAMTFYSPTAAAQDNKAPKETKFEEYRRNLHRDFQAYRASVFENYDKFLSERWSEYERFKGESRYEAPKPRVAPAVEATPAPLPASPATPAQPASPEIVLNPTKPSPAPSTPAPSTPTSPATPPTPATPATPPTPTAPSAPSSPASSSTTFDYYGIELGVPSVDLNITRRLMEPADYGRRWRELADTEINALVVPALHEHARDMGLNDYLTLELARAWADGVAPDAPASSRLSLAHYVAVAMGYDVRIAKTRNDLTLLLVPFEQQCYARPYLQLDGRKYYVFADKGIDVNQPMTGITTCRLPQDSDKGRVLDLRLGELRLPDAPQPFSISSGPFSIQGSVNRNLQAILYRYPQMPMGDYAASVLQPGLRRQIVGQIKNQLGEMSAAEAVDALLAFVQRGFEYATDEDFHGFEKPYFFEEMLLYPKCDCEDRAVFYTYLLWNVLGVHSHMLHYPGHESAAVALDVPGANGSNSTNSATGANGTNSAPGAGYTWKGVSYLISDPTYIGSRTGMCMPQYSSVTPEIDFTY